ncbi:1-hydroxycarotenoid 3,4-desaturase CrtD [Emticicia sp. W12TSBA100-4]|uniref:1-hydroxycarotenoid 3,4-desaturase CrtD n=1 Tax=Emticicia sp. W12TSBA100-4 TaxID=3160965 RepID=UPI0033059BEC
MKTAIIGAGIGGIATAIRLASKGHEVEVFEANTYPGGKLSEFQQGEYRFDAGPSLFTMPLFVTELFELSGRNPDEYFQYIKLPEVCRYFWDDGTRLNVSADINQFAKDAEKALGEPSENIIQFLKEAAFKYEILSGLFLEDSLHKFSTWTSKKAFKGYLNLPKLGIFGTMNKANESFFKQPKTVQLFNRYATYNGSDPYQTPATLNIIPHLEYNVGAFFPKDGMFGITQSLVNLAKDLGVKFHFGAKVEEILVENEKVKGLRVRGSNSEVENTHSPFTIHHSSFIISNMDVTPTYRKLLPNAKHPDKILNQAKSGSGLIFYWGIKKEFKELGLHNIFFSNDYKTEFEHQFQKKTIYHDPTIYLNITSKYKKDDAPEGCENWFILLNAPANEGQDWDKIIIETRQNVIDKLSRNLGVNVADLIENESILDPRSIEMRTSSAQGALYGNSSNNKFAAFLRHANFSSEIKNLYFVGGSVHPGGGIPLALSSAKIVADMVE